MLPGSTCPMPGMKPCAHSIALKSVPSSGSIYSAEAFGSLIPAYYAVGGSYSLGAGGLLVSSSRKGFP